MKPTHTGRLKNIQELIEALINDLGMNVIGKEYLSFLSDNEGSIIEVVKCQNHFENDDFGFVSEMFSKIIPIKPKKETRPFTDEELLEHLYTDGWFMSDMKVCYTPSSICEASKKVTFVGEDKYTEWESFQAIIEIYTDRHGNKFEKEL